MLIISFVLMFAGIVFFIMAFSAGSQAARRLVDFQFKHHHEAWLRDGRPVGGKVTRRELSFLGSDLATVGAFQRWAFRRPEWLPSDSDGERLRVVMVRWGLVSLIGLVFGIAGLVLFGRELIHAA